MAYRELAGKRLVNTESRVLGCVFVVLMAILAAVMMLAALLDLL